MGTWLGRDWMPLSGWLGGWAAGRGMVSRRMTTHSPCSGLIIMDTLGWQLVSTDVGPLPHSHPDPLCVIADIWGHQPTISIPPLPPRRSLCAATSSSWIPRGGTSRKTRCSRRCARWRQVRLDTCCVGVTECLVNERSLASLLERVPQVPAGGSLLTIHKPDPALPSQSHAT